MELLVIRIVWSIYESFIGIVLLKLSNLIGCCWIKVRKFLWRVVKNGDFRMNKLVINKDLL